MLLVRVALLVHADGFLCDCFGAMIESVDPDTGMQYFRLSWNRIEESEEVGPGIVVDFDAERRIVGIKAVPRKSVDGESEGGVASIEFLQQEDAACRHDLQGCHGQTSLEGAAPAHA